MSETLTNLATYSENGSTNYRGLAFPKTLISLGELFCFLVPALQFVRFDLVGELSLSDVLILVAFPIALLRHPERLRQRPVPTILALGGLWFISQVATDLLRDSAPMDFLRGWTKILFLLASFTVVWTVACRSLRRLVLYGSGTAIGAIVAFYLHPYPEALISPWKFALGIPVTLLVVIWVSLAAKNHRWAVFLPFTALTVVDVYEDFRFLAAATFLTAIFYYFHAAAPGKQQRLGLARLAMLGLTIICGAWGFAQAYSYYAERGALGDYAMRKLAAQTSGTGGVLLGGRGEILASGQAILDSPVIGHGSWPRDPQYAAILAEQRAELGYKDFQNGHQDDLIPSHSYVFGSWVEAGVAGGLFWLYVLSFTARTLLKASGWEPLLPLFAFAGFSQLWDILFSPLGVVARVTCPFYLAATVVLWAMHDLELN